MKLIKELKGGSLSSTKVIFNGEKNIVRKSISRKIDREYGLVRWQSQIRKLQILSKFLPEETVAIERIGVFDNCYFYDVPYYENCINCFDALLYGESELLISNEVAILLSKLAEVDFGLSLGALSVYIDEEIRSPLVLASDLALMGRLPLNESELIVFQDAIRRATMIADKLIGQSKDVLIRESLTHGNLTLENLLWDRDLKKIIMIDPYYETYCDSIMGDVSQILQSTESGYEYVSKIYETKSLNIENYPCHEIPECLVNFSIALTENICNKSWYSKEHLQVFYASQFTRMFPFKLVNSPRQGVAFMMHGINLLEKIECC